MRALTAAALVLVLVGAGCPKRPRLLAKRVTSRAELIGGPRALGEVGDWLLENDKARFIVQDDGFSRGFGVFGGSLVDADLVREATGTGDATGGRGKDNLGEMFPAFFVEAVEPLEVRDPNDETGERKLPPIEVENDGSDGTAAVVVVRGYGNDFLALTQYANELLLDDDRSLPRILFTTRYKLAPNVPWIEIETTVQNVTGNGATLDWNGAEEVLGVPLPTPLGDVVLFGAGNDVFMPHEAGYDLRYRLEREYKSDRYELPAFPGLVGDFVATSGPGVSYGIVGGADPDHNYAFGLKQFYPGATPSSVHVPFIASAFTGVYEAVPPPLTGNDHAPGGPDEFTYRRMLVVGDGDVASVAESAYRILGVATGKIVGRLVEEGTRAGIAGASVIAIDERGRKLTQCKTDVGGRFDAALPPGTYRLVGVVKDRAASAPVSVAVTAGQTTTTVVDVERAARVVVTIVEPGVGPVPAKATLVGTTPADKSGVATKDYLFDLSLREPWRYTDLVPDDPADVSTRLYVEQLGYTHDGTLALTARPGDYTLIVSRGPEYDVFAWPVTLRAGQDVAVTATVRRVVDTPGYVSADFHLHSIASLDSFASLDSRITSYAGEGLEFAVSTDHNFIVDYAPVIANLGMQHFIGSAVGLELSTIDRGHYNGYPLRVDETTLVRGEDGTYQDTIGSRTFGSFNWVGVTPQGMFDGLRGLGLYDEAGQVEPAIVQVNHPRGAVGGYFAVYGYDKKTLTAQGKSGLFAPKVEAHPEFSAEVFSYDFDALEVINGKRNEFLHDFPVPEGVTIDPISCCPVTPGQPLLAYEALDCDAAQRDCTCTPADTTAQVADGKCASTEIAIPGVVEDWLSLLAAGVRAVGTANSDSHSNHGSEAAVPRTFVRVPVDAPGTVSARQIAAGVRSGDVLMTNGPFVVPTIGGRGMGAIVDASSGAVTLSVDIDTAPWVQVDTMRVWLGEERLPDVALPQSAGPQHVEVELLPVQDSFVVVEVTGHKSLFPVILPNEETPVQLEDALTAVGGSFGLSGDARRLQPALTGVTTALALTNPIWLDVDGDGEIAPLRELTSPRVPAASTAPSMARHAPARSTLPPHAIQPRPDAFPVPDLRRVNVPERIAYARLPWWLWPTDDIHDVRRVWWTFLRHTHAE